ncbi:MAG: nicotinamide-nucleotide adenylyltransferase [Candidatus Caldarchaeum sp.]|nr:nicotinamide-nucleotide adenylyltransferase [Candidatus Caldarchaeum sp.]
MRRGLFIGRFQPFHLGHLKAVSYILEREDECIVGVGSAQYSHTVDNPFTAGERIEIIHRSLKNSGIELGRCFIIPIPDVGEHMLWVSRVISFCPAFQTVYSNNSLVRVLFEEVGFRVEPVPLFDRGRLMGTEIRKLIAQSGDWRSRLHPSAVEYLMSIECEKRLATLLKNDF